LFLFLLRFLFFFPSPCFSGEVATATGFGASFLGSSFLGSSFLGESFF